LLMVYFQIGHGTTWLALPIVPTQHFLPQCLARSGFQPHLLPLTLLPQWCSWEIPASEHSIEIEKIFSWKEQHLWIAVVQIRPREKTRTDHLQTITSRSLGVQHPRRSLDRLVSVLELEIGALLVEWRDRKQGAIVRACRNILVQRCEDAVVRAMSNQALSVLIQREVGIDAILHYTCRDRAEALGLSGIFTAWLMNMPWHTARSEQESQLPYLESGAFCGPNLQEICK
jgi:hypothetical protein